MARWQDRRNARTTTPPLGYQNPRQRYNSIVRNLTSQGYNRDYARNEAQNQMKNQGGMTRILRGMLDEATNGSRSPRLTRTQRYWSERANAETPQYAREVARDQGGIRVGAVNVQTINTAQGQTPAGGGGSSSGQRQGGGSGG